MDHEYVCLTEKEEMWARMLMQVLEDNEIPCSALPVHGAGMVVKTGMQESLRVFVPERCLAEATELLQALFSAELLPDEEE